MGTRSITRIQENGKTIIDVYRQFDGYVDGQGRDLANLLKDRKMTNGIMFGQENNVFNGAGCLAANIVWMMKKNDEGAAGGVYVHEADSENQEYTYIINVSTGEGGDWGHYVPDAYPTITVIHYDETIFEGNSQEFCEFVEKDEVFDE